MMIDSAFATAMHATRCISNTALGGYSPGALVFNRDMFLNIPLIADILTLQRGRLRATCDDCVQVAEGTKRNAGWTGGGLIFGSS